MNENVYRRMNVFPPPVRDRAMRFGAHPTALIAIGIGSVVVLASLLVSAGAADEPFNRVVSAVLLGTQVLLCLLLTMAASSRRNGSVVIDFFAPGSVLSVFHFVYILVPAYYVWLVRDYDSLWFSVATHKRAELFNETVLIANLGLLGLFLGYRFALRRRNAPRPHARSSLLLTGLSSPAGILVLLVIGAVTTYVIAAQLGFDITTVLLGLSVSLRETTDPLPGYIQAGTSLLMWGCLMAYWRGINTGKSQGPTIALCGAVFVLQYVVFTGKRSYVAPILILPAIWSHYRTRWWTGLRVWTYAAALGFLMALLLMIRILVPLYLSSNAGHNLAFVDMSARPLGSYLETPDLAIFDMMEACVSARDSVLSVGGGWLVTLWANVISPIFYAVPRQLWPGKPEFQDLSQIVFRTFIGTADNVGFGVGYVGVLYIFGGTAGVFLGSAGLGYVVGKIYSALSPATGDAGSVFVYALTAWVLFIFARYGTPGFTVVDAVTRLGVGVAVSVALVLGVRPGPSRTAARGRKIGSVT